MGTTACSKSILITLGVILVFSINSSLMILNSCHMNIPYPTSRSGDGGGDDAVVKESLLLSAYQTTRRRTESSGGEAPSFLRSGGGVQYAAQPANQESSWVTLKTKTFTKPKRAATVKQSIQKSKPDEQHPKKEEKADPNVDWSRVDTEQGFAGCLMIMDDNHFLVEWLAYHYFTMPLRHLTVMIDPKSRTSPQEIFDRWKGKIEFDVVNWTYPGVLAPVTPAVPANETAVRHYLGRQHKFYEDCMKNYKLKHDWKVRFIETMPASTRFTSQSEAKYCFVLLCPHHRPQMIVL